MRYHALACDYDGTLARAGRVPHACTEALRRLRESGRRIVLVTGRELPDLQRVFPHLDLFDGVVAENGALLHLPASREEKVLAESPPPRFLEVLREREIVPLSVGKVIVATRKPRETEVLEVIRDLGLELQVLHLRAQNLALFLQLGEGVDDATWVFHLRRRDFSRWFREMIKDEELALAAEALEHEASLPAGEGRRRLREAVEARYTGAA